MSLKLEGQIEINCVESRAFQILVHQAAKGQAFDMIDTLLTCDFDAHFKNEDGQSILHLLALGDPSATSQDSAPQDHVKSYSKIITLIVGLGIDINSRDSYGYTPLHLACAHRNTAIVIALLQNGADINIEDGVGDPPIFDVPRYHEIHYVLHCHIEELMLDNLYVSEINKKCYLHFENDEFTEYQKIRPEEIRQAEDNQMGLVQ